MKQKKKFKDTKFGAFLNKASEYVPEVLNVGSKLATGNIVGAVTDVKNILTKDAQNNQRAKDLLIEFQKYEMEYAKELYELEIADRDSARNREVELAKTGKTDWLMYATGCAGLGSFCIIVYAVVFGEVKESAMMHQMIGLIEGVALTIFAYYFGTSKSSKDKDEKIQRNG